MANQPLGFGDKHTADVRLHLINSAGLEHPGNPLLLHSKVLKKAEFFEIKLSQRWSSDKKPFEIKVTCSYDPEDYVKCIQLMYPNETDEPFNFSNIDEALAILQVSCEVMCSDCMGPCMRYLCAVRWSPEQEATLRVLLSSLHINILPDLTARLGLSQSKSDCKHIEMGKEYLQELLSPISSGDSLNFNRSEYRETVEKHMLDFFKSNTLPAAKVAYRDAILKEFNFNVEKIKCEISDDAATALACDTLSWLMGVIQKNRDAKLFETVVKMFCEDADLPNVIAGRVKQNNPIYYMLTILIYRVLKALGEGEIITPVSFRLDFLTNWAPTIAKLIEGRTNTEFERDLKNGIIGLGETLPLVEQNRIYNICKDSFTKNPMITSSIYKWWAQKLHDAFIANKII